MNSEMRVLVTGAAGFIGSHLAERLVREGLRVRAMVHYNSAGHWHNLERLPPEILAEIEIVPGDVTDPFSVNRAVAGCEVVFHLASLIAIPYSYRAPSAYVATNVVGALNVLQACKDNRVSRLVHTSTSEVYGTAQYVPIDERHPLVGQSPYSASKIAADKLAESFHRSFGTPVVTVRPFNTFGPRQSARAVIPTLVSQALLRQEVRLGSLEPVRDFLYVEDTVAGFLALARAEAAVGQVVNLASGSGVSVADLVTVVEGLLGRELTVAPTEERLRPAASEVMRLIGDNSKARQLSGWAPRVDLQSGLASLIEYVRQHSEQYKTDIYNV